MSLEEAILKLAQAIENHGAALQGQSAVAAQAVKAIEAIDKPAPKKTKAKPEPVEAPLAEVVPALQTDYRTNKEDDLLFDDDKPVVDEYELTTFDDVVQAFKEYMLEAGRDKAVAMLAKFGIKGKLTKEGLPEVRYLEFVNACVKG